MRPREERLHAARLYLVCGALPDEFLGATLAGGVDLVQLRMKDAGEQQVVAQARRFAALCAEHEALFILNDRPDLLDAAGADGVHLGQEDMAVTEARKLVGGDRLIGLSTHSPQQIEAVGDVDYIAVGPIYETPTKPGTPAVGLELIEYAAVHARVPFFAIGGISTSTVGDVRAAGATRIAVVRALTEAADPELAARELREEARVGSA